MKKGDLVVVLSSTTHIDSFYTTHLIRSALRAHPTSLFLHGTTGTRVVPVRVRMYQSFATCLRANVLSPNLRGFADSTGTPSEVGLMLDTRAAWDSSPTAHRLTAS
jgi:hypothetical protein